MWLFRTSRLLRNFLLGVLSPIPENAPTMLPLQQGSQWFPKENKLVIALKAFIFLLAFFFIYINILNLPLFLFAATVSESQVHEGDH